MTEYIVTEKNKTGKIFLNKEAIDSDSLKQIKSMIRHESIHNARVMPDCHNSMGCCVGFTSKIIDKIVPNFVGGDIGCGITTYPIIDFKESKLKQFGGEANTFEQNAKTNVTPRALRNDCGLVI